MTSSILEKIHPDCVAADYWNVVSVCKDELLNDTGYTEEHWEELKEQIVAKGNDFLFEGTISGTHKAFFGIDGSNGAFESIAFYWHEIVERLDLVENDS